MTKAELLSIGRQFGLPLYVYDGPRIKANLADLRSVFGDEMEIHFACKALSNPAILQLLREYGCGIDAVSKGEIQLALACGFAVESINFTPSGAPLDEYLWAMERGVHVHVDNLEILDLIGQHRPSAKVSLRFNPGVRGGGHVNLQVGANDSKFGIYPEELPALEAILSQYDLIVRGVHVHVGSDVSATGDFLTAWRHTFAMAGRFSETVEVIDLGGGFKPAQAGGGRALDLAELNRGAQDFKHTFEQDNKRPLRLLIEPGKYLTGNAGYFLVEVTSTKRLRDRTFVYVNSGFNHFLRPMYYGVTHPVENLSRDDARSGNYTIVGYLCETDTFARDVGLKDPVRGDVLCFGNAGAYAATMASNYNLRPRPAEVLWNGETARIVRPPETIDAEGRVIWYES